MSDYSEQPDEAKLDDAPAPDAQAADSFWSGNPDELPDEVKPVYKNLQADYTRKSQEIAAARKEAEQATNLYQALNSRDPDVLRQIADAYGQETVLEALGYAIDDEEPEPTSELDALRKELDGLKANLTESQQKAQEEALLAQIEADITKQFSGLDLDEKQQEIVTAHALTAGYVTDGGFPDVRKAYEDFQSVLDSERAKWAKGKRSPRQPVQGASGTDKVDLSSRDERQKVIAAMLEGNSE